MNRIFALLIAVAFFVTAGCHSGNRLTKANVAEVSDGMSKKQVESILGNPTSIDTKDLLLLKTTTYVYNQDNGSVTIVFKDDKVTSKESTLRD
jgi:outer membrane protein assembly factor BamE (lipoprotein component of BamABCDE complex)